MQKGLIFTYVLTYGGAAVSLFRPYWGFLIYVSFALIRPESLWSWAVSAGNYSRIVAIGMLCGWAFSGFGNWRLGRGALIIVSMVAYWFVLLFGAFTASNQELGWSPIEPMAKVFLPMLVGATLIDSWIKLRQFVWVIVLSQGYLAYEFNLTFYDGRLIAWEFTHGGLDNNGIAITMVTSIGLAFYLGLYSERWWQKVIAFGLAGLMAHVVLFSNSRGGMLSLLVSGIAYLIVTPIKPRDYLILLLGAALVFRLAGPEVQKRFLTTFASKDEGIEGGDEGGNRLPQWKACIDSIAKRPLGVGPCHWPYASVEYGLPKGQAAHSTWLQMGAELGWPGLICLFGIYGTCLLRLWPLTRRSIAVPDPWARYMARMVFVSLFGFVLAAQFVTVDGVEISYYVALAGAATLRLSSSQQMYQPAHSAAMIG